jgi:hypothetical protein
VLVLEPATFQIQFAPVSAGTGVPDVVFGAATVVFVPAVPTAEIVTCSWFGPGSTSTSAPTASPATLVTLMLVAPGDTPPNSRVVAAAVPTAVTVRTSRPEPVSMRTLSPTAKPATLATLTLVSPAFTGYTTVVGGPAAVPIELTVTVSVRSPTSIVSGAPTT